MSVTLRLYSAPKWQSERLDALRAEHWNELQVEWRYFFSSPTDLYFSSFGNRSGIKGNGAMALADLLNVCDAWSVRVELWTDVPKLYAYYEAKGFVEVRKGRGDTRFYMRASR